MGTLLDQNELGAVTKKLGPDESMTLRIMDIWNADDIWVQIDVPQQGSRYIGVYVDYRWSGEQRAYAPLTFTPLLPGPGAEDHDLPVARAAEFDPRFAAAIAEGPAHLTPHRQRLVELEIEHHRNTTERVEYLKGQRERGEPAHERTTSERDLS